MLEHLNEAQRQAVLTTEGMIRVIAGAGSGKTGALVERFAYLVNALGILPGNILCVTFTNKSANEMRQRIHRLTGDNDTGYINTFHGFCVSVLQEDSHAIQYPKSFLVLDNSDIDAMLKIIYEERGLTLRDMTFSRARDMIEMLKIKERPEYYLDMLTMSLDSLYQKYSEALLVKDIIFYGYLYQEKKCFGLDYNDLIKFTLYIFSKNKDICLKWQKRLEYIMIDEFQDIDALQYQLMEILCAYHKNLFVVGDPDQTIYTWRGANVRYLLDFDKHFANVRTIMMMENYRSTSQILDVANSLIEKNQNRIKKTLIPKLEGKRAVVYYHGADTAREADWIADQIQRLHEEGKNYQDMAILYRAHYVTRVIEEALLRYELPYRIYSGVQFFGRAEVKDALSYLRMVAYQDDLSFLRIVNVPKRNIGERRTKFLKEYAQRHSCSLYRALCETSEEPIFNGTKASDFIRLIHYYSQEFEQRRISELLSAILDDSGYEEMLRTEGAQERLDNLAELKQSVYEYEVSCGEEAVLEDYLAHVALFSNSDGAGSEDKVRLMTVHSAKGLEFPYVFLCGMNEGIFPSRKVRSVDGMEEERRLAFVAVTRAKQELYLTESEGRNLDGSPRYPSRFILDIDQELLEIAASPGERLLNEARDYSRLSALMLKADEASAVFSEGQRVTHLVFGPGTVHAVESEKKAYQIKFDGMETVRTISFKVNLKAIDDKKRYE